MINVVIGNNLNRTTAIVNENTTLRAALESNGVDYSIGMTSLDGSTLRPGDLDKTFAEMGITEKCFLINVVKADNAARVKIVGGACVLESGYDLATIKLLSKYRPEACFLYNEKKEPTFGVSTGSGKGSATKYGVTFGEAPSNGFAAVTMMLPECVSDPVKWAEDTLGAAILNLNKLEDTFEGVIDDVRTERAQVAECITVA